MIRRATTNPQFVHYISEVPLARENLVCLLDWLSNEVCEYSKTRVQARHVCASAYLVSFSR